MLEAIRPWTVLMCAALVACGPRPDPRHPKSDASEDESEDKTEDASDALPSEDSKPRTEAKPAKSDLAAICEKVNRRAGQKCKKKIAGLYQSSCNHYLKEPGQCEEEIRLVMECQYKAADEAFCAHEADPKCHEVNQKLKVCKRGTAPAEQETAEDTTIPSGWEKVRDPQLGFAVAMPPGATLDEKSKRRTWQAEENGISYFVAELEPPTGKLSNPVFVRTVIAYVGNRCQQRLKLHGELETKGTTVVQYHSACPDGSEWHGMLHFWGGKVVSTGYHAPAGSTGVGEPYFYSFQIGK